MKAKDHKENRSKEKKIIKKVEKNKIESTKRFSCCHFAHEN